MAIVLNTTPPQYTSAHGDILFVAYEATKATDPVTYPNYKYVVDIYITGHSGYQRLKAFPHPDNNRGIFNLRDIVRSYLETTFNPAANALQAQELGEGEFFVTVTAKFGEEVDYVLTTNLTVDSVRVYFNHYNGRLNGSGSTILSGLGNKITTNRPLTSNVYESDTFHFIPYFGETATAKTLNYTLYDANLVSLDSGTSNFTPTAANMQVLNVSPARMAALFGAFPNNADSYTIQIDSGAIYRFKLTCEAKYEVHTLHWLNQYGGFDSFNFTKVSRKSEEIERKSFTKLPYRIDGSGVVGNYNSNKVYHEQKTTFATTFRERLTLNSDLLNDAHYTWLGELVKSPMIYIQQGDYFLPVSITNSNYDYRKVVNDRLTNLVLNVEYGSDLATQYR